MWSWLIAGLFALSAGAAVLAVRRLKRFRAGPEPFLVKPYLQLGDGSRMGPTASVELIWHSLHGDSAWSVCYRLKGRQGWSEVANPNRQRIAVPPLAVFYRFSLTLSGLEPGGAFEYKVLLAGNEVFRAEGLALKGRGQNYRVVVVGDVAEGTGACKPLVHQISMVNPDLLVVAGDITYKRGRIAEYLERFFPVLNSDTAAPDRGAPVIRSRLLVGAAGNHDMAMMSPSSRPSLSKFPDLLAYFVFWSNPLNGPVGGERGKNVLPLSGTASQLQAVYDAAGPRYPRMTTFSFDAGDSHWLVLDANAYMDWTDPALVDWVESDLSAAGWARWRFACFHQPGFNTDLKHGHEQRMRLLAPVFEKYGVDVVFSGHNHAYERCYPLRYRVRPQPDGAMISSEGHVDGDLELDRQFDGTAVTVKNGVLYLVTGGGGALLNTQTPGRRANHNFLPEFTFRLVDDLHSFTVCDVEHGRLTFRQISAEGVEVDCFTITKP